MNDIQTIWKKVLTELELGLTPQNFATWFKNTTPIRYVEGVFTIGVTNEFVKEWLLTKYQKDILKLVRLQSDSVRSIEIIVVKKNTPVQKTPSPQQQESSLPFAGTIGKRDNLNPRYTFDTFIIGPFNELAYSAAQAIINKPGVYNPLFIYGPTGLGKTHLIQAVGNTLKERNPDITIFYTSSEKFQMDYVSALQNNRINAFKEKYRTGDVLIMDDIQLLSGRERTQEELFHLFNILYDKHKQIIFSSDKHPNYITSLEDRLKSRFSAGMIVDISKPEYESRIAILQAKSKELGIECRDEVYDYIANHVEGNIRELEGILHSIMVQQKLRPELLTIQDIKSLIKNNIKPKSNVSVDDILDTVAQFYNIEKQLIIEKTRRKEVVRSRQVAMYLLREDYNISFPMIGRKLGGRDHTTVIHSCEKIKNDKEQDGELNQEIEQIRAMLTT